MAFKINISHKGKTYNLETDGDNLVGLRIGDTIKGELIDSSLSGYELEITGTSDKAGFPGLKNVEGPSLKRVILTYGTGMKKKPKGEKKKNTKPKGLRLRKTVRGNEISEATVQINTKVKKEGDKKFESFFQKNNSGEE